MPADLGQRSKALPELVDSLNQFGFAVARKWVPLTTIEELRRLPESLDDASYVRRSGSVYGIRQLLTVAPHLYEIATSTPIIELARAVLGNDAKPVKGIFFDKTPDANWPVPWHQDVTITVLESREVSGFEMRPVKDGVVHAIPPVEISENMVALRIHLDDATADHGALRVIPGSHRSGRLPPEQMGQWLTNSPATVIPTATGDILLMRPLLLHASSPCQTPGHRRVIHIEYADRDLPGGLEWAG